MTTEDAVRMISDLLGGLCLHDRCEVTAVIRQLVEDERERAADYVENWLPSRTMWLRMQLVQDIREGRQRGGGCTVPPGGWRCTRTRGHDGPCAALPLEVPV